MRTLARINTLNWLLVLLGFITVGYALNAVLTSQSSPGKEWVPISRSVPIEHQGVSGPESEQFPSLPSPEALDLSAQVHEASLEKVLRAPEVDSRSGVVAGAKRVPTGRAPQGQSSLERAPNVPQADSRSNFVASTGRAGRAPQSTYQRPDAVLSIPQSKQLNPSTIPLGLGDEF